jgi:segregation and condensation protein B
MSLKAKLEAVIYAAEEPVTLAQLAALFAADALEWKAEQASNAEQAAESRDEAAESAGLELDSAQPFPFLSEETEFLEQEQSPFEEPAAEPVPDANPDSPLEPGPHPVEEAAQAEESPTEPGLEARRLARLRDREVRLILQQVLDELIASYASDSRGLEIREIAGGFRMATKPECHDAVRAFVKSLKPALKLSLPALETLAVIAYKQPVTAPEVNEIRGVDSSAVFGSLLARKLIATAGRKPVIGRPILYRTTREFLLRFGLKDVSELPSMEEFEKMAAIEFDEPEPASTVQPFLAPNLNPALEFDESAPEDPTPLPSIEPETIPAEAAPAAPSPAEQAETETLPQ